MARNADQLAADFGADRQARAKICCDQSEKTFTAARLAQNALLGWGSPRILGPLTPASSNAFLWQRYLENDSPWADMQIFGPSTNLWTAPVLSFQSQTRS